MRRGQVYWVNLEPAEPPEFGKTRPAVVVSNSQQNLVLPTVAVVPLSTRPPAIPPLRLRVEWGGKPSFAVTPGIRQVSKTRLTSSAGELSEASLAQLDAALREYLGD